MPCEATAETGLNRGEIFVAQVRRQSLGQPDLAARAKPASGEAVTAGDEIGSQFVIACQRPPIFRLLIYAAKIRRRLSGANVFQHRRQDEPQITFLAIGDGDDQPLDRPRRAAG